MKKFLALLCAVAMLSVFAVSASALGTEVVVPAKTGGIKVTVIDDFSSYSGEYLAAGSTLYKFENGKLLLDFEAGGWAYGGPNAASPSAGLEGIADAYNNAAYIGLKVKNTGEGVASIAFEKDGSGEGQWMTQLFVADGCKLVSAANGVQDATYTDISATYRGNAVDIPAGFDGYLFIPFSSMRAFNDDTVTGATNALCMIKDIHFAGTCNNTPTILEIDNLCLAADLTVDPNLDGGQDTADLSVIAYAAAAITGCGALVVARKRK